MKHKKIKGLHFQTYFGKNYENGKYGKLLLLGESHYLDEDLDSPNLTKEVLKNYLNGLKFKSPFFRKIGLAFNPEDRYEVWHNVAFSNLIQKGLPNSKSQPNVEQKASVNLAFKILLENINPEKVIILSKRMWTIWLTDDGCTQNGAVGEDNHRSEVWEYEYPGGKCLVIGIYHPSTRGFSSRAWAPVIKKFLTKKIKY